MSFRLENVVRKQPLTDHLLFGRFVSSFFTYYLGLHSAKIVWQKKPVAKQFLLIAQC